MVYRIQAVHASMWPSLTPFQFVLTRQTLEKYLTAIASGYSEIMYTRLLPTPRERSGDWLKLNAKQFGRLWACGRRRGRAAIRKEKRRPA
jgi:hypothetical protein